MKKILDFKNFFNESIESREELIDWLSSNQNVYDIKDLDSMSIYQLTSLKDDVESGKEEDMKDPKDWGDETSELEFESKKWIQDAIKKPGALRRSLNKKKGEKIPLREIDSELEALKGKVRRGNKLTKPQIKKERRLALAKTLSKMRKKKNSASKI